MGTAKSVAGTTPSIPHSANAAMRRLVTAVLMVALEPSDVDPSGDSSPLLSGCTPTNALSSTITEPIVLDDDDDDAFMLEAPPLAEISCSKAGSRADSTDDSVSCVTSNGNANSLNDPIAAPSHVTLIVPSASSVKSARIHEHTLEALKLSHSVMVHSVCSSLGSEYLWHSKHSPSTFTSLSRHTAITSSQLLPPNPKRHSQLNALSNFKSSTTCFVLLALQNRLFGP